MHRNSASPFSSLQSFSLSLPPPHPFAFSFPRNVRKSGNLEPTFLVRNFLASFARYVEQWISAERQIRSLSPSVRCQQRGKLKNDGSGASWTPLVTYAERTSMFLLKNVRSATWRKRESLDYLTNRRRGGLFGSPYGWEGFARLRSSYYRVRPSFSVFSTK